MSLKFLCPWTPWKPCCTTPQAQDQGCLILACWLGHSLRPGGPWIEWAVLWTSHRCQDFSMYEQTPLTPTKREPNSLDGGTCLCEGWKASRWFYCVPRALLEINKWKVECASALLRISLVWAGTDTSLGTLGLPPRRSWGWGRGCSSVSPYEISLSPLGSSIIVLFSFLIWSVISVCLSPQAEWITRAQEPGLIWLFPHGAWHRAWPVGDYCVSVCGSSGTGPPACQALRVL